MKNNQKSLNFQIEGGRTLHGEIEVKAAKNSAVALLCASLLNQGTTVLNNIPKIEEVNRIIEVLASIDVEVKWLSDTDLEVKPPKKIRIEKINKKAAELTRSALMLFGPLIHLLSDFSLPQSGGCKLGTRTIKPHIFGLEKLGISIKTYPNSYQVKARQLKPARIVLYESGDTVTENVLMAAAKISGKTTIKLASANYMVQELCLFLEKLGIKIEGIGTTTLTIYGKPKINRQVTYQISEDPIEAMLFLAIAATTNSSIIVKRCPIEFLELELLKLEKMGFKYEILRRYKAKNNFTDLVDIKTQYSELKALEEKIYARPFPGLNIDNLPFFVPIATQAKGQTLIHDWIYENRAIYYMELTKLGADMTLLDPHRVVINGPINLKATQVICPPALRPAAIIFIAMLAAKGTSILRNVYSINRGYEDLCTRLNKLGAKIQILEE